MTEENQSKLVSSKRIKRIRAQGYFDQTAKEVSDLSIGNRFAYQICTVLVITGVVLGNVPLLATLMGISFFGILLPNHPFDYLYNFGVRHLLDRPAVPKRSKQLKFACTVATLWLGSVIWLFHTGATIPAQILGGMLASVAFTVATFDFCLPSFIYNTLFRVKVPDN